MKFPVTQFGGFCSNLLIDSKELGQIRLAPDNLLGTQKFFIKSVVSGLEDGIHFFVTLKGRQEGITTICGALDLFWHYRFPGMQGTFASHNEEARDNFRAMLTMYHQGLPPAYRQKLIANNRYFMAWRNRSKLAMQIGGGSKSKGGKGRGMAFTFIHATECSSWEDDESLASILASLAQTNEQRLQNFESTARGFNLFQEMWADAKNATTQRAIFIGWWLNDLYRKPKTSNEYRVYWDGTLKPDEREWVRAIKLMYKFTIDSEQIAWWRWMLAEIIHDENHMMQEYPPTEEHAFILSGNTFFSIPKVQELSTQIDREPKPKFYRLKFGDDFLETRCEDTIERLTDLCVWEEPDDEGFYSIGADPAFGSSDWADQFVIEVYRCYADRFEQVAEYCVTNLSTYQYAWVLCYLAGAYKNSMINLEVNGPGKAVLAEMNNLRRRAGSLPAREGGREMREVLGHMRYYLYRRIDSPGGSGAVYHTVTTHGQKEQFMNTFRDLIERNHAVIHSKRLTEEMKIFVREDGFLGASGRAKDDCCIASGLAADQYNLYMKSTLERMKSTWGKERERREKKEVTGRDETPQQLAVKRTVGSFLKDVVGIQPGDDAGG